MKPKHFVGPVLALAVAGLLLAKQRRSAAGLESENLELRRLIVDVPDTDRGTRSQTERPVAGEPIAWEKLAGFFRENPDGELPGMFSIQRRLLAMDTAELLAALDGIAAMDLDDATRLKLETMILDPLCKKDPEAALERFKGMLWDPVGFQPYMLTHALKDWAKRDVAAAEAWLDREIAAGTFEARSLDGMNENHRRFESAVVFGMFAADPARAEARLSKLPPEMRAEILGQSDTFHKMRGGDELAYAEIVRRQLDEKGRLASIAERARRTLDAGGDFATVDGYLDKVQAAPDERKRAAEEASRRYADNLALKNQLNAAKIEEIRAWAARDAPGSVGRLTGEALSSGVNLGSGMDFAEASALALRYRESEGNDDALHGFLSTLDSRRNKAEARKLAVTITDPGQREKLLKRFE